MWLSELPAEPVERGGLVRPEAKIRSPRARYQPPSERSGQRFDLSAAASLG